MVKARAPLLLHPQTYFLLQRAWLLSVILFWLYWGVLNNNCVCSRCTIWCLERCMHCELIITIKLIATLHLTYFFGGQFSMCFSGYMNICAFMYYIYGPIEMCTLFKIQGDFTVRIVEQFTFFRCVLEILSCQHSANYLSFVTVA
jgi:hypothetical protein